MVIPASSIEENQKVKTEIEVLTSDVETHTLPPDVESVSCFYKIETTGKFSQPIKLFLQHNVEITSEEESKQLAFVRAKGPPPYEFKLISEEVQMFGVKDKSGEIHVSDFSVLGIVWKKMKGVLQPDCSYTMMFFYKQVMKAWQLKVVVTRNLGPYLEVSV